MNREQNHPSTRGSALVIALIIAVSVLIITTVGTQLIVTNFKELKLQKNQSLQADNIARAGLQDALFWFRRQTSQPVSSNRNPTIYPWTDAAFEPINTASTTVTIDPSVGIVKEFDFALNGANLWARYEVKRQTSTVVAPYDPFAVHDISGQRIVDGTTKDGDGLAWYLCSKGYIYVRNDPNVPFDAPPNKIIAKAKVSTEIRRISLNLQVPCAVIVDDGGSGSTRKIVINAKGRVFGGTSPNPTYAIGRRSGNAPKIDASATVVGSPSQYNPLTVPPSFDSPTVQSILGVPVADLKIMANLLVKNSSELPSPLPDMNFIFIDGNATFNAATPMTGSGILFVNGNLTVSAGSNSYYNGFIYVTGTATINDPCTISGAIVAFGGITLSRSGATETADITYDKDFLDLVRQQLCNYREMKSTYRVFTGISDK